MAKTTHTIRSSTCACCRCTGATRRCQACSAYYCSSTCQAADVNHAAACQMVASAVATAARCALSCGEAAALDDYVTVVDFQLSLPPLEDDFAGASMMGGCGPEHAGCCNTADGCTPPAAPVGTCSAAEFLTQRTEGLEAVVDWLAVQAPHLLSRRAADLLLATALRLRDGTQDAEVHLIAWAILDRCLTAGTQCLQDALMLQHSSLSDWSPTSPLDGQQRLRSPRQLAGLDLVSPAAEGVLAMLAPVTALEFADQNPFHMSPLELPPPLAMSLS